MTRIRRISTDKFNLIIIKVIPSPRETGPRNDSIKNYNFYSAKISVIRVIGVQLYDTSLRRSVVARNKINIRRVVARNF